MELNFGKFTFIAILLSLCYTCLALDANNQNQIKNVEKTLTTQKQPADLVAKSTNEKQDLKDQITAELGKEYYKDCVDNLKWALGIIVGLVIVFVGYAMFKSSREYREALADVKDALKDSKEASKEAKTASDKAREYEEKASEKLFKIDEQVTGKLKEIEERGKALINDLIKEAEKQRETSRKEAEKELKVAELWNKGLRAARDEDFQLAANSFGQMVEEFHVENESTYNNWGVALADTVFLTLLKLTIAGKNHLNKFINVFPCLILCQFIIQKLLHLLNSRCHNLDVVLTNLSILLRHRMVRLPLAILNHQ